MACWNFAACSACVIGLILVFGLVRRVPLFDTFLEGAKEGAKSTFGIIPALVGLITAVSMLKASGALDMFTRSSRRWRKKLACRLKWYR